MNPTPLWHKGAAAAVILLTLFFALKTDYRSLTWAEKLISQGSPAPQLDSDSPTGYELGQRHFLATRNHGTTYRWIAYTQELVENGPFSSTLYLSDAAPTGRVQQLPKLYAGWLAAIAGGISLTTGHPLPIAIEKAALWEPILSHAIALAFVAGFIARRFNIAKAAATTAFLALFPFFSAQFVPGSIDADRWALLLASAAIAISVPNPNREYKLSASTAVLAALALAVSPTFGFIAVLAIAAIAALTIYSQGTSSQSLFKWSSLGAGITAMAWFIDQNPVALETSELRYNHPLYAIAWLGIGLTIDGSLSIIDGKNSRSSTLWKLGCGIPLLGSLFYYQIAYKHLGWLYATPGSLRPSDLDAPLVFKNSFAWLNGAGPLEIVFILLLPATTIAALGISSFVRFKQGTREYKTTLSLLFVYVSTAILAVFKIRWGIALSLISLPLLWQLAQRQTLDSGRYTWTAVGVMLFSLFAWNKSLPDPLRRPSGDTPLRPADLQALVQRHLSHWLATHNPSREVHALASPAQSDSLIFHGNCTALLSTAWESYPGQIAASRILSAPENTEVQAVLESREITHILLPSWDDVLPQLVQEAQGPGQNTFFERLQTWVLPLYLRAIPYHLPAVAGFESEKLAVFEICPQQDEALSMSRLTEYFVEMKRMEPASTAAHTIEEAYPQDPNASAALSIFYKHSKDTLNARKHSEKLSDSIKSGYIPFDWDRRVVQAIALALNNKRQLARVELEASLETMNEESLYQLTPLQTYQLLSLSTTFSMSIPSDLLEIALKRCSEYL
ncbi:hypothetical protein [Pelagicoccus sp. SDUM812005]|uniref:hypothetical protein n=1 Tax=Pelagicoccus sp. SDUM812005 TaxID=3041257 RepID=UPI00280C8E5F|nr:hypothetical protein [Pelagicoccus sp. SDUM812005]MDQ8183432.1 hypothetical protein [Pelagicoccus sp. SDUM812005]